MATSLERFEYDDAIVRKFAFATIVWGAGRDAGRACGSR